MSQNTWEFDPPIQEDLGGEIKLLILSAEIDRLGGAVARVQVWNGSPLYTAQVALDKQQARKRFVEDVIAGEHGLNDRVVTTALVRLAAALPDHIKKRAADALPEAVPGADVGALREQARGLAEAPDLLDQVAKAARDTGLVGEERTAKLIYLAATARLQPKPVNVVVKGPSSSGKSYVIERVLALLPASAFVDYTSVSPRYLAYTTDDLRHRIVALDEAGGIADGVGVYIIRSLLSKGRLDVGTVDKDKTGGLAARQLVKQGPTGLFTSSTRHSLDRELETRCLTLEILDTPEHSRAILAGLGRVAAGNAPPPPDLGPLHALQDWLALAGERRVLIPYAERLALLVTCRTVRIRRDFAMLLSLLSASAILHQAQRPRGGGGVVRATMEDYRIVHSLMAQEFSEMQQDGLTPRQREAVAAVASLCGESAAGTAGVTQRAVRERLGIGDSATHRRLKNPIERGYLRNLQTHKGCPAILVIGEPMPEAISSLPTPEELAAVAEG